MDGWYMGSFVYRAFKELRREKAAQTIDTAAAVDESAEDLVSR
jgi:hypothetical protein